MYLDCLHCLSQLHQLELYIQFLEVIFLVWHDEMILLPSLCYTGLASFLDYFKVALSNITLVCLLVFVLFSFISYSHYYYYCPDFVLHPHSFRLCTGHSFHCTMSKPLIFDTAERSRMIQPGFLFNVHFMALSPLPLCGDFFSHIWASTE